MQHETLPMKEDADPLSPPVNNRVCDLSHGQK